MELLAMMLVMELEKLEADYGTRPAVTYRAVMHKTLVELHATLAECPEYVLSYTYHYHRYVKLYA